MNARVEAANASLEQAKENLATSKSLAGVVENKEDAINVSEDDTEKDVFGKTSERIQQGLASLQSSLQELRTSAEQMIEEEQNAIKRPRLESQPTENASAVPHGENPGFG